MQYRMYEGIQRSPLEGLNKLVTSLPKRSWLPASVAGLMAVWIALVIASAIQTLPGDIGAPTTQAPNNGPMQVTTARNNGSSLVATSSDGSIVMNGNRMNATGQNTAVMSSQVADTNGGQTVVGSIVDALPTGGRGGGDDGTTDDSGTSPSNGGAGSGEITPTEPSTPVVTVPDVTPVTDPVVEPVVEVVEPVVEVIQPVTETLIPVTETVTNTVQPVTDTLLDGDNLL